MTASPFTEAQLHRMLLAGACPELFMVARVVAGNIAGTGVSAEDVVVFVCGHAFWLNDQIWRALHVLAGPSAHPLDGYPPQIGPVKREMSLSAVEKAIGALPEEHVVVFDGEGRQVARFGPAGTRAAGVDPRGKTLLDPLLKVRRGDARDWVLTHNHPTCGTLSTLDLGLAVRLDLHEIRAVCPGGEVWRCLRPRRGWPNGEIMEELCEDAALQTEEELDAQEVSRLWMSGQQDWRARWNDIYSNTFQKNFNAYAKRRGLSGLEIGFLPARPRRRAPARR